ncbi:TonB-dependent receptor [Synoicihabitans lomoniglobus]|uniref:TonB-dependent receptor n=1 Tax=Synoicihabitans lomoniglobus TaxID=2909285 RepID=A0AAF0A1V0_9BACT|nr:TonB-dependent receptor [Opitutaceae bacterium LMO-M01]WED65377.1 TonB-dependent receptor [Opitutaceae bacterium LMO-M01]
MKPSRIAALGSLLFAAAFPASAQTVPSSDVQELDTLVVTADLWSSELARTSASATVFAAEQLAANGNQSFGDLVNATPNLTWAAGTSRARYFQIRGIGENSQFEGESPDSSVRFLIDDLDFTGIGGAATLFDTQQVEVLRGPQAGAFGANAAAGVIKLVSADPTPFWTGYTEATVANDDHLSGGFAVGGPLSDKVMFRVAAQRTTANGWRDNAFLNRDDTDGIDETALRLKLRVLPSDAWQWDATLFYADQDNGYDEFSLDNTGFTTYSDIPGHDIQEATAGSLRGVYTGNALVFTTKTSFTTADSLYSYDSDWTYAADPRGYDLFLELSRERETFNQEFRVDREVGETGRWTLGAYYESLVEDTFLTEGFGDAATRYDATTMAVFGQWGQELTPGTRLVAGLRVEDYDLATDIEFRSPLDFSDTLVGGKLTLEQDLGERTLGFASLTRGYKAGGANIYNYLVVPDEGPAGYDTEIMWNYEIGLRTRSADGRLSGEIIAFHLDRDTPQVRDSAGYGGSFTYFVDNGKSASITGAEASFRAQLAEGFSAYGSLGLMNSDLDAFTLHNTAQTPAGGRELANVPAYTYSLGGRYDAGNGFWASAELNGRDDYFESNTHDQTRSAFNVVNASVGYRHEQWSVTLWARNLLDERYEKRIFYFANAGPNWETTRYESPADPRQVGLTVRYSF